MVFTLYFITYISQITIITNIELQARRIVILKFKTKENHNLAPGDIVSFNSKPYNTLTGDYYIDSIIDNKTFSIKLSKENSNYMLPSSPDSYLGGETSEAFNKDKYDSFKLINIFI